MGAAALLALAFTVTATGSLAKTRHGKDASSDLAAADAGMLAIQINDDPLTLQMARVPQVHLHGPIDRGAPDRFAALGKSGRIKTGVDIYLDSPGGDLDAAMQLGRMFRAGGMVTHLGTPRRSGRDAARQSHVATCVGACVWAYFGGEFRWAPTGQDRLGMLPYRVMVGQTTPAAQSYLTEMGIDLKPYAAALSATGGASVAWLDASQMLATRLADNGIHNIQMRYRLAPPAPYLVLSQNYRDGSHQLRLECAPGKLTLSSADVLGGGASREIAGRARKAYFELNRKEQLVPSDGAHAMENALVMNRVLPSQSLPHLISAQAIGAWVEGSSAAYRTGFVFDLAPTRPVLKKFYDACWKAAPWKVN